MKSPTLDTHPRHGGGFFTRRLACLAAITAALCGPVLLSASPSVLGTGVNYAAFGEAGVTIAAPFGTTVTASLGTAMSTTSITGTQYLTTQVPVVLDLTAAADIGTAYNRLSLLTPTDLKSEADILGSSAGSTVLVPGIYRFQTTAQLDSILTLDAQGKNGAVWIFQIGTTLTTVAGSQVVFANLGSNLGVDNGVFWIVGSTANLGSDSLLLGNVLTGTEAINLDTTARIHGAAYAHTQVTMAGTNEINTTFFGGLDGGLMYDSDGAVRFSTVVIDSVDQALPPILSMDGSYNHSVNILNGTATLAYVLTQDGKGHLSGEGTLSFVSGLRSFTEPLTVKGKVTRAGGLTRVQLFTRSKNLDMVDDNSVRTPFRFDGNHRMEFHEGALVLAGRTKAAMHLGQEKDSVDNRVDTITLPLGTDGTWNLQIDELDASGNGAAMLVLADGRTLLFSAHANSTRNDTTRYVLKGRDFARGSTLNLLIDADQNVLKLDGNVLGQVMKSR